MKQPGPDDVVYPGDSDRITVIGRTGSGKTQGALWLLAHRSYTSRPWVLLDFKREGLIGDLPRVQEMRLDDKAPKKPGLYVVRPHPGQDDEVEALLWQLWERENIGLYVDEGYMIDKRSAAFQALLTQGRAKQIPVIMLTQRPVEVTRFAFSEADYLQLYGLTDERDRKTVRSFMPMDIDVPLPPFHSYWYDAKRNRKFVLQPAPGRDTIIDTFRGRIETPARRFF